MKIVDIIRRSSYSFTRRILRRAIFVFISMAVVFLLTQFEWGRETLGFLDDNESVKYSQGSIIPERTGPYRIAKVIDGDTLDIDMGGEVRRVRLLGINTPETVDLRKTVECFGIEASNKTKELLSGKNVYIESDPTQGDTDKYGRLLRYIYLEDGTFFNRLMISEGYAYEYTYEIPYKYQEDFKSSQLEAMNQGRGLWSETAGCDQK